MKNVIFYQHGLHEVQQNSHKQNFFGTPLIQNWITEAAPITALFN